MEWDVQKSKNVVLYLTEEEAVWLKSRMQNPMVASNDHFHEPVEDANMRDTFWQALEGALQA